MKPTFEGLEPPIHNSRVLRQELERQCDEAHKRYPILAHQDAIGLTLLLGGAAGIVGTTALYARDQLPAWACVVVAALFMSILHELEHDLIHRLYFRTQPWLYNTAMLIVWAFRPGSVNPWIRREWHLHHHRASGTSSDLEERGLTNGEAWGWRRVMMSIDPLMSVLLRPFTVNAMMHDYTAAQKPADRRTRIRIMLRNASAFWPSYVLHGVACHAWLGIHLARGAYAVLGWSWQPAPVVQTALPVLDFVAITFLLPDLIRTICLYFVSSNIHYYGDIETRNLVQQTQVWDAPWLWPVQLFCFNFGSTHAIHHFAVQHPCYVRQLIARDAHRVMKEYGVRFNDFSSMGRANRWHSSAASRLPRESRERAVLSVGGEHRPV